MPVLSAKISPRKLLSWKRQKHKMLLHLRSMMMSIGTREARARHLMFAAVLRLDLPVSYLKEWIPLVK